MSPSAVLPGAIGVLGGMGPEATILLQSKLLTRVAARDDADHVPLMIDMNPAVPSRIAYLIEGTGPSPAPVLVAMARRLTTMGAVALAMPCNTAHAFAAEIRRASGLPLLHMVDDTAARLAERLPHGARVGMLASPAVEHLGLFDAALGMQGLAAVWPASGETVLGSIRAIKRSGATAEACAGLLTAAHELLDGGADHLLVACTEFSLAMDRLPQQAAATDSLDVLADAVVSFWRRRTGAAIG